MPKSKPTRIQVAGPHPVYIQKRGSTWHIDFSIQGKQYRFSLKEKQEVKARDKAKKISTEIHEGSYGTKPENPEIAPLLELYLESYKVKFKPKSYDTAKHKLDRVISLMKIEKLSDITARDFEAWRIALVKSGRSARTANTFLVCLKAFLNWVCELDYIEANPLAKLKNLKGAKKKIRRALTDKEVKALIRASDAEQKTFWKVFLLTGLRKTEFTTLRVSDLDLKNKTLRIAAEIAKNKTSRLIGIHKSLIDVFRNACKGKKPKDKIFTNKAGNEWDDRGLLRSFEKCRKAAKIAKPEQVDIHSLRVTFCTNLALNGIHPKVAMELMGHKTLEMTMLIYTKVEQKDKHKAIDKLPNLD